MRRSRLGYILAICVVLVSFWSGTSSGMTAQDDNCPEGLVYYPEGGICLLPENMPQDEDDDDGDLPPEEEPADEDPQSDADDLDQTDGDLPDDDSNFDDTADDSTDTTTDSTDVDDASDDNSDGTDDNSDSDAVPTTVTNVVLHTFTCPEGWDVEREGHDASYDPCSTQPAGEGSVEVVGPEGAAFALPGQGDLDAASTGTALAAGSWKVSQTKGGPAWANCLVFDHDGNVIEQVTGPVEGTSITFELSGGDWLECEWFINGAAGSATGEPAGDVTFTAGRCPYGYAPTLDRQVLLRDCTLKGGGGTITLSVDSVPVAEGEIPSDNPVVPLTSLIDGPYPSGEWTVDLKRSDDASGGIVFCDVTRPDGSPASTFDSGTKDSLTFTVAAGDDIACAVYVIEKEPRVGSARGLTIIGHLCPEGTLRSEATLQTCNLAFDGGMAYIEVDLYAPDDTLAAQSGLAPDTRQWTFAEVDTSGTWRLDFRQLAIDTPPNVTCTGETLDGQTQPLPLALPADGQPGIDITVGHNHKVTCDLLLFTELPADTGATGQAPVDGNNLQGIVANPPAATGMRVNFQVVNCDLSGNCAAAIGVVFNVSTATETVMTGSTNTDGSVEFINVPPQETIAFIETIPAGYGEPEVVCVGTTQPEALMEVLLGNQIRVSTIVPPGETEPYLDCTWSNIPAMGPEHGPNIFIQARDCGITDLYPGVELDQAELICPDVMPGVEFHIKDGARTIVSDETDSLGQAIFTKLPIYDASADYSIIADLGSNFDSPAIFCDLGTGDRTFSVISPQRLSDKSIQQTLEPGATMRCSWFVHRFPGTPGADLEQVVDPGVSLVARLCNPDADLTLRDLDAACPTAAAGIMFSVDVSGEPYISDTPTDAAGMIELPLPAGDTTFTITPHAPPGYGLPAYHCANSKADGSGGGSVLVTLTADTPSHDLTWSTDSEAICTYLFPVAGDSSGDSKQGLAPEGEAANDDAAGEESAVTGEGEADEDPTRANTLTIQFWTCPEDADPAADQTHLLLTCAMDQAPRSITVTTDAGARDTSVTGSAAWPFTGNRVTVTPPADIAGSSAWCSSSWVENGEDEAEFPDAASLDAGVLSLTVAHPATTIYCDWFLFGAAANGTGSTVLAPAPAAYRNTYVRRWSG